MQAEGYHADATFLATVQGVHHLWTRNPLISS